MYLRYYIVRSFAERILYVIKELNNSLCPLEPPTAESRDYTEADDVAKDEVEESNEICEDEEDEGIKCPVCASDLFWCLVFNQVHFLL